VKTTKALLSLDIRNLLTDASSKNLQNREKKHTGIEQPVDCRLAWF